MKTCAGFGVASPTTTSGRAAAGVRRAGTIVRSPLEARKDRREQVDGEMRAADVSFAITYTSPQLTCKPFRLSDSF